MKKKHIVIIICIVLIITAVFLLDLVLTHIVNVTNTTCLGQKFSSAEEALQAMEKEERKRNDTSLDYCPPYELVYTFDYDNNTIIVYSYHEDFDENKSDSYAVRILKHNKDGTLSFDGGFADLILEEPKEKENYYFFTNIKTKKGTKSISFLCLPSDSDRNIYVDGVKSEKILVSIEGKEFYLCYAVSHKDTFLSNILTPISARHKIKVK